MCLQNHNLWLNPTDADHHRPLQVVLRAFSQKNFKFEGQMSAKQRQNRDRFAPKKRSTANTGYKRSEDWEEAYSQVPPWKTRDGEIWQNYDQTEEKNRKKWGWEPSQPSYSASSSSSATGSVPWRPSLAESSQAPWQKRDEEKGGAQDDFTWEERRHKY